MQDFIKIRERIEKAWSFETSYCDSIWAWELFDGSYYQCKTTAWLLYNLLGGSLCKGVVDGREHVWNVINGIDIDLTWRQFLPGSEVRNIRDAEPEDCVNNKWEVERYLNLKQAYNKQVENTLT